MEQLRDPTGLSFRVRTTTAAGRPLPARDAPRGGGGPQDRPRAPLEEVLADAQTARYVEDWGRSGDTGCIAESPEGTPLGRLGTHGSQRPPGYGFDSESVPEISMAVGE